MRHLNDFEKMCDVYAVKMVYGIWVEILWVVNQSKYNVIYYSQPFSIEDVMWQPLQYEFYLKWEILSARRFFFSFFFATNFAWVFLKFILFFSYFLFVEPCYHQWSQGVFDFNGHASCRDVPTGVWWTWLLTVQRSSWIVYIVECCLYLRRR